MIIFDNWVIRKDGDCIVYQGDNLVRTLTVLGQLPEGWRWELMVRVGSAEDTICLDPVEGGVGVTLTAEMLACAGWYAIQLRGICGDLIRHTNAIYAYVPGSLAGMGEWPEYPSEFQQAENNIRTLHAHPPIPGDGYWLI